MMYAWQVESAERVATATQMLHGLAVENIHVGVDGTPSLLSECSNATICRIGERLGVALERNLHGMTVHVRARGIDWTKMVVF